jgi:hypothetical protein
MGHQFVRRRRSALTGRARRPPKTIFRKAAATIAAAFLVKWFPESSRSWFLPGRLIRPCSRGLWRFECCLQGADLVLPTPGTAWIVVGMQHLPTTFFETVRTPKKAADARLFGFTAMTARTRLQPHLEFGCSRLSLAPGGLRNGTVLRR